MYVHMNVRTKGFICLSLYVNFPNTLGPPYRINKMQLNAELPSFSKIFILLKWYVTKHVKM